MICKTKASYWLILLLCTPIWSHAASEKPLLSVEELSATIGAGLKIIDVRPASEFIVGHIPGAVNCYRTDYEDPAAPVPGMRATREQMHVLLSKLGVNSDDRIVLYDNKGGVDAARLAWIVTQYGHKNIQILDGGLKAWELAGGQLSVEKQKVTPTLYSFPNPALNRPLEMEDVKIMRTDPNAIILDVRSRDEYLGRKHRKDAQRAGHIPGAFHIDWAEAVNLSSDKKFKNYEDLKQLYSSRGIDPEKNIVVYCHSGVRSAHTTFVLKELLGYENVENYDGSWLEWAASNEDVKRESYWERIVDAYIGSGYFIFGELTFLYDYKPWWQNYFYWLLFISLLFFLLEYAKPWRVDQPKFRKDFWLDFFYMFFNFFIFSVVIFYAASEVAVEAFNRLLHSVGVTNLVAIEVGSWPTWAQLLTLFLVRDFIQWWVHRLLHRVPALWEFHKVHHSVEQMGFAAHLRYHWMETIVYRTCEYIPLAMIGFGIDDFFIVHLFALTIGHWNHSNLKLNIGPLKYIFNNPQMHIWHHAHDWGTKHKYGVNFGLSLSIWDYLFRTNYIPKDGRDIPLGFPKLSAFPKTFFGQFFYGFRRSRKEE